MPEGGQLDIQKVGRRGQLTPYTGGPIKEFRYSDEGAWVSGTYGPDFDGARNTVLMHGFGQAGDFTVTVSEDAYYKGSAIKAAKAAMDAGLTSFREDYGNSRATPLEHRFWSTASSNGHVIIAHPDLEFSVRIDGAIDALVHQGALWIMSQNEVVSVDLDGLSAPLEGAVGSGEVRTIRVADLPVSWHRSIASIRSDRRRGGDYYPKAIMSISVPGPIIWYATTQEAIQVTI